MHQTMKEFFNWMRAEGRVETIRGYTKGITSYWEWLQSKNIDPIKATTDDIRAFQRYLAEVVKSHRDGMPLGLGTQQTRLSAVKSYYGWMARRGLVLVDVT